MKKFLFLSAVVVVLSGSVFADTVNSLGSTAGFTTIGSTISFTTAMTGWTSSFISTDVQTPFWNNPSMDTLANGHLANIGDVLAGLATGTNEIGADLTGAIGTGDQEHGGYYGVTSGGSGDPNTGGAAETVNGMAGMTTALAFNLTRNAVAYNIALLFADSSFDTGSGTGTVFGTYTGSGSALTLTPLFQPATNTTGVPVNYGNFNPSGTYGFYATVCYSAGNCETYTTGNGNFGTGTTNGGQAWNHFALFQLASGNYVLGFEDANGMFTEGIGDFNDIVVALVATPEPGTIGIMGLGLAALGFIGRRRFARK
jgi:PEP-CTERM motif